MGLGSIIHQCSDPNQDKAHIRVEFGQSISTGDAEEGVAVVFNFAFATPPKVVIGQHQEKETWIDPNSVSTTGFTWYATQQQAGVDWLAIGEGA